MVARVETDSFSAVVVRQSGVGTGRFPAPDQVPPGQVLVRVAAVGLCRTDLRVVNREIGGPLPLIPGHEFSGVACSAGQRCVAGDRVVINPVLPCGECVRCRDNPSINCRRPGFLGVDCDGACAEFVLVPETSVYRVPHELSFQSAVFAEPVAASLAVLRSGIRTDETGVILGTNRIAILTKRILSAYGFDKLAICPLDGLSDLESEYFDYAVETLANTQTLAALARCLKPQGRLILKSRQHRPVELTMSHLLPGEPLLQFVNYGSFEESVRLLAEGLVQVDDLIGSGFLLDEFEAACEVAGRDEQQKVMIWPNGEPEQVTAVRLWRGGG